MRPVSSVEQHIREGRFQRSLAAVAALSSILSGAEVTYEHYRGSYSQQIMYSPVLLSVFLALTGLLAGFSRRAARTALPLASVAVIADGLVGFVFHIRGVTRRPGGWRIPVVNVVMGPPVFAPLLFGLSGYLGLVASFLRREDDPAVEHGLAGEVIRRQENRRSRTRSRVRAGLLDRLHKETNVLEHRIREGRFQRNIALVAGLSALLSGAEAAYSHYKNDFQYAKLQWSPLLIAPALGTAGIASVWSRTVARTALPILSVVALLNGMVGTFYHGRGVLRRPGGPKLALYNVIYGPPIFAPMLFSASGFMGLLASLLRRGG